MYKSTPVIIREIMRTRNNATNEEITVILAGSLYGTWTHISAMKTQCPDPLDEKAYMK